MTATWPVEALETAFWEYERALMANDLPALDRLFAPGPDTIRGDAAGILVGHDAISAFRQGRGGAPARTIETVEVRPIGDDAALVIAVTVPATGGRGQQTQLWQRIEGRWVVAAAHVSLPAPAVNSTVWRVVGTPLTYGTDGPLAGETIAVKDLFAVEGFATGGGVPAFLAEQKPATHTAPAVTQLLSSGASVTGIARTDEFAYSIAGRNPHYGTPPNPSVPGGIPGGSSSGPASAVALGQASIGLGTDTGGSIRVPASYLGLWGLRTTHGAVSRDGLLPLAPSFDTVGWLTRSAAVLRGAASASLDPAAQVGAVGFAVDRRLLSLAEPAVAAALAAALDGLDVTEVDLGDVDHLFETFRTVQAAEAWRSHGAWIEAHPGSLGEEIAARFAWASTITAAAESAARSDLVVARERIEAALGDTVLVLPSASSIAPSATADAATIERVRAGTLRLTCIAGLTGRPGLSVPMLSVPQSGAVQPAPVGLCLVGPRYSDLALIDLAEMLLSPR